MDLQFDPECHRRRSIRLQGYDYRLNGAYYITIVTQDRACLFGEMVDNDMRLNDAGRMVLTVQEELHEYYPGIESDTFVVMPNHIHGIIVLVGAGPRACPGSGQPPSFGQPRGVAPTMSLADVVHRFKTLTTRRYIDGVKTWEWLPFRGKVWQRNYYEHIIRDERALNRIRQYIVDNPVRWTEDMENPAAINANRSRRDCP